MNDVNHIVKKSITKLSELQEELQELDSQLLVTQVSTGGLILAFQMQLPFFLVLTLKLIY